MLAGDAVRFLAGARAVPAIFLSEQDVERLLPMADAIEAMSTVFRKFAMTEVANIPRGRARTDHGLIHLMGSAAKTLGVMGCKVYTTAHGAARFLVQLHDGRTGELLAILAADRLGQIRTGATSGLATRLLANPEADRLGLIGAGKQARTQLEAIHAVRPLRQALVHSRSSERTASFAAEMSARLGIDVRPSESVEKTVRGMPMIATATSANQPFLKGEWVEPGCHLNVIGSNFIGRSEVDPEAVRRAAVVVVEEKDQARIEAGDLHAAVEAHAVKWSQIQELGMVLTGSAVGRKSPTDITLFKSVGSAMEDIAAAKLVYDRAVREGLGVPLPF
jgi:ornithine cyclodeaminase/alanine dehydrogenase-like protein (mu-crystallin family)